MRPIMSIDYGKKRIGIAISDELRMIAVPFKVLINSLGVEKEIFEIAKKRNVEKIIVGIPFWDKPSKITDEIKTFVERLKNLSKLEIELVNEFYSTKIAQEKLYSINKKLKKYKNRLDSFAACVILQDYLDSNV
ncbi:MAG: Holliday junction resolvase RuvX [Endomicrobia bacterium]|nr:Holliday junction resolvase RuvX [Endomicrobiia bacterium]